MKHLTPIKLSVSLAALILSQASFAGGTDAGTVVENTATISYSVGGAQQADITSAVADFKVDQKVDLTVTGNSGSNIIVSPSTARATTGNKLTYVLKNEGNSSQNFKISLTHLPSPTDNFDAGTGTTAAPQAPEACTFTTTVGGVSSAANAITATPTVTLAKDTTATIDVICSMPNRPDVSDGHISTIDVLATAVDGSGVKMVESAIADREDEVDVVLADGNANTTTDTAARNAMHSDTQTYEIDVPMLTVVKTSTVVSDPFNSTNPKRIPGAVIKYTITVSNSSDKEATGVTVKDLLSAVVDGEVSFDASSMVSSNGAAPTYSSNTVEATGITVPVATSAGPGVATVTFEVTIL